MVFSRKLDDVSEKYPDAREAVERAFVSDVDFVVDAEIIARATDDGAAQASFQSLASRKRKKGNDDDDKHVRVRVVLFDLLWYDGRDLCPLPLSERRAQLVAATRDLDDHDDDVVFAKSSVVDVDESRLDDAKNAVEDELAVSVAVGCEGLVLKALDAPYDLDGPSRRSDAWLKLKRDYLDGLADSLDLVPIGGWRGSGVKRNWISPILLATYDANTGTLGCVTRCMTGFSHAFYADFTKRVLGRETIDDDQNTNGNGNNDANDPNGNGKEEDPPQAHLLLRDSPAPGVDTPERCAYWFEPVLVWEIHAAGITPSPTHRSAAGIVHEDRGLSCRFPRFVRERPDKAIAQATSPRQLADLYQQQPPGQRADLPPRHDDQDDDQQDDDDVLGEGNQGDDLPPTQAFLADDRDDDRDDGDESGSNDENQQHPEDDDDDRTMEWRESPAAL
mmetsp:Transcript_38060/g.122197  ORF Transcript_38060/g.122197 Transcript_38060/m.122197 type:complete len:447 (+) Transcript_38060:1199-2539(+)